MASRRDSLEDRLNRNDHLVVRTKTHFTDGSDRDDYTSTDRFRLTRKIYPERAGAAGDASEVTTGIAGEHGPPVATRTSAPPRPPSLEFP